jgi:hypothetical protein
MNQTDLFSVFDDCERTRARSSDPDTSVEAAHELVSSGRLNSQCRAVLDALRRLDGSTSAELGQTIDLGENSRHVAGRRLPDLERRGLVRRGDPRKCRATGRRALTWWVVE